MPANGTPHPDRLAVRRTLRSTGVSDRALVARAQLERTPGTRRAAVEALMPLARSLARRYHRGDEPLDDLEQVAFVGLLKAIDGFDVSRETSFAAYAVPTIVGELRRHFRDKGWTVKVPRDLQELSLRIGKVHDEVAGEIGRPPTPVELAGRLGEPVERVLEARELGHAMRPVSLDRPAASDPDIEGETLIDRLGAVDDGYSHTEDGLAAQDLLGRLPERQRRIVELRFCEELTQSQIGERLGVSQMQVSRILRQALSHLNAMADELERDVA